ncbi:hypothetical protein CIHG_01297 [Coccidioides immitis H538.4]|uniref:Uncharacterized protein n=3 Tax=Coccidioides immitis TaxID=5501 RepID=A0A0J8QJZ8_COCIT|nr:hypothetical protein CIRG_01135 [Coccidioides immitis RMSCC 2394]KMU72756.1 hypothetical protein CISG_03190 [Coccidioides immitis RMSCC 3703]KMU83516.1 hypothetical protein CIHG_01297 [Coccidioides immitis H538.4]
MHANGRVTVERQETLERISKTGDLVVFRGGPSFVTTAKDDGNQDKFETQDRAQYLRLSAFMVHPATG